MQDFLLFNTFVSPSLLIIIYYIGALLIPILCWYLVLWIYRRYLGGLTGLIKDEIERRTTLKERIYAIIIFISSFIMMEIFWRVMFEFFIAYFNMHDALMRIS